MVLRALRGFFLLIALAVAAGCESPPADQVPPVIVETPLELDPTDEIDVAGWWSDGLRLLQLAEDGAYTRYGSLNRYREPVERGRWSRDSYAVLWLQPYDTREPQRIRVPIQRSGGELVLWLPSGVRMLAIDGPPPVLEDRLVGRWTGDRGVLRLHADLSYALSPVASAGGGATGGVGHRGRWSAAGLVLRLEPEPVGVEPILLEIREEQGHRRLVGPRMTFEFAGS